jgi:hypothetical protein
MSQIFVELLLTFTLEDCVLKAKRSQLRISIHDSVRDIDISAKNAASDEVL